MERRNLRKDETKRDPINHGCMILDSSGQLNLDCDFVREFSLGMKIFDAKERLPSNNVLNTIDYNNNQPCSSKSVDASKRPIENAKESICSLCFLNIQPKLGVTLQQCKHNFCRQCLIQKIYNSYDAYTGTFKCPFIRNCNTFIFNEELKELLGNEYFVFQVHIKYMEAAKRRKQQERQFFHLVLLNMNYFELSKNLEPFECKICFMQIEVGEGIVLQNCLHQFCKECLAGCVETAEEFEVKCPFIDNEFSCKENLREIEIRSLVSKDVFRKHLQKSLQFVENAKLTFHCRTPDCPAFVEVEEGIINFKCETCNRLNCIRCNAIHEGKSCIEYQKKNPDLKTARVNVENIQTESTIEKMIQEKKAIRCPRCKVLVEKMHGCDFVICMGCKLGICWITQKPRDDFKKADGTIVKGCGCLENGILCHPRCRNCH